MSSNTNQFDITSLLAQLRQQQRPANDVRASAPPVFSSLAEDAAEALPANSAPPPRSSSTMNPLMSNFLQAINSDNCTPLSQAAVQMNCNMPAQDSNGPVDLQGLQNLLTSAKMLSSVNPKLAAAAIDQALALAPQLLGQAPQPNVDSQLSQQKPSQCSLSSQQGLAPFALLSGSSGQNNSHMQSLDPRNLLKDTWSNMSVLAQGLPKALKSGPSNTSSTRSGSNLSMDMPALLSSLSKSITSEVSALSSMQMGSNHLQDRSASNQQNNTQVQYATQPLMDQEVLPGEENAASQPKQPSMSSLTQSGGNHGIQIKPRGLSSCNSLLLSLLNQQHQNGLTKNSSLPNLLSVSSFKQIDGSQNRHRFSSSFPRSRNHHQQQQQSSKGQVNSSPPTGSSVSSFTQRSTNHAVKKNAQGFSSNSLLLLKSDTHHHQEQSLTHKSSNHYIKSLMNEQVQQHGPNTSMINKPSAISSMQIGDDSGSCDTEKRANSIRNAKAHDKGPQTSLPSGAQFHPDRDAKPSTSRVTVSTEHTVQQLTSTSSGSASSTSPSSEDIAAWKNWKLAQLESYIQSLNDSNQPTPNALQFLVDAVRKQEMKQHSKRESNRKSAKKSRKRKKELIEDLVTVNDKFRRQVFILSFLPDPVIAIAADGEIKFCGAQVERVFGHKVKELIGANIQDIITPCSRSEIRKVIKNVVRYDIWQREEASNNTNAVISQSSDGVSTPLSDKNESDEDEKDQNQNLSGSDKKTKKLKSSSSSVSSITERSMSVSTETSTAEDSDEPSQKKIIRFAITNLKESQGSNKEDSEDSGYSAEISVSVEESSGKGRKRRRFAPAYTLRMIRHDLTTVVCEMTCSVLDEDNELSTAEDPKDLLLSLRPLYEDKSVGEDLRYP